jgi:hypothetical protein
VSYKAFTLKKLIFTLEIVINEESNNNKADINSFKLKKIVQQSQK